MSVQCTEIEFHNNSQYCIQCVGEMCWQKMSIAMFCNSATVQFLVTTRTDGRWQKLCLNQFSLFSEAIYELHLLGGYADDAKRGHKLTQRFMKHLHDLPIRLNILTCCLGPPNTRSVDKGQCPKRSLYYFHSFLSFLVNLSKRTTITSLYCFPVEYNNFLRDKLRVIFYLVSLLSAIS